MGPLKAFMCEQPTFPTASKIVTSPTMAKANEREPFNGVVVSNVRIDAKGDKETYLLTFKIDDDWVFEPGKAIGVKVKHSDQITNHFAERTKIDLERVRCLDITGIIPKDLLTRLELTEEQTKGYGLIDVLDGGLQLSESSVRSLSPRYYSICNSPLSQPGHIQFVYNMTDVVNSEGNLVRYGVGSTYLRQLKAGGPLLVFPRAIESKFCLPEDPTVPLVMICAGTGVAPFIGFLQHLYLKGDGVQGPRHLYFGVRHNDYIFKEELQAYLDKNVLTSLHLATSREEPRQYVQHMVEGDADWLYQLMTTTPARIYICGDELTMVKDVNATLTKMCEKGLGDARAASKQLLEWSKAKRVLRDIWVWVKQEFAMNEYNVLYFVHQCCLPILDTHA